MHHVAWLATAVNTTTKPHQVFVEPAFIQPRVHHRSVRGPELIKQMACIMALGLWGIHPWSASSHVQIMNQVQLIEKCDPVGVCPITLLLCHERACFPAHHHMTAEAEEEELPALYAVSKGRLDSLLATRTRKCECVRI